MQDFGLVFQNVVLWVAVAACFIAQVLKLIVELARHGKVSFRTVINTGGMPSAHSAFVTALASGVGQSSGWDSPEFAVAVVFAIIVMYDAAGVRQAAGKQARVLNKIVGEFFEDAEFHEERLKELLGHTPVQVIAGCALGVVVSWLAAKAY